MVWLCDQITTTMAEQIDNGAGIVAGATTVQKVYRPTITLWNRLEPRPRTTDFERALKAEIRDPLWMLSKQWQMGEFQGEDAGSAILAKVHMKTTKLTRYQAGEEEAVAFDDHTPLEVKVEHQEIPFELAGQEVSLDLRLLMGRHWLKLLSKAGLSLKDEYVAAYGFVPPNPADKSDAHICSHVEVWQQFAAVANRGLDGYKLYQHLKTPGALAADGIATGGNDTTVNDLSLKYGQWFEKLYYQPIEEKNASWKPAYLEHQFACSAPKDGNEKVLIADEYYQGHLDWYNLDVHPDKSRLSNPNAPPGPDPVEDTFTLSFLPSPVTFPGMPHSRWWTLEEWKTNLGNIKPNTTDLNQLMVLDFGLNYANDWFMLPFTLPVGSIANVEGVMVTNVFGENIWVEAAGRSSDEGWQRWSMFNLNVRGNMQAPADFSLLLLPAAPKVLEGQPLEEVYMLRDEIANMVWGVESKIPLATGKSKRGKEAGLELKNKIESLTPQVEELPLVANKAKIQYQIVNSVLENWIPFIPVHKKGDNRQIQLQRAAMPRILEGTDKTVAPQKVEPRTSLLRQGLDEGTPLAYYVHEEEVPRAGIKVQKSFQRTRWQNGAVFTWLGIRKQVGRGEGHSGLAFDQILPRKVRDVEEP